MERKIIRKEILLKEKNMKKGVKLKNEIKVEKKKYKEK